MQENVTGDYCPELGMRQLYSFAKTTTRQRNKASGTRKNLRKKIRSRCLDGVATPNIVNIAIANNFVA